MKFILLAFALVSAVVALPSAEYGQYDEEGYQDIFSDIVNNTLNKFIKDLSEPWTLDDININSNEGPATGTAVFSKISISGMKQLVAPFIKLNVGTQILNMTVNIPHLSINLDADVNLLLLEIIPLYGTGSDNIELDNVVLTVNGKADISDIKNGIKVKDLQVIINLNSFTFNLHGILNDPVLTALINVMLNDNVADFINKNNQLLSSIIGKLLEDIINGN